MTFEEAIPIVQREHIEAAIAQIDREGFVPKRRNGRKFSLQVPDSPRFYPPKYVLHLAIKYATGELVRDYSGGRPTNSVLEKHGFTIVPHPSDFPEA
jgi:5-methylcytosine-specific restriction enzyme A